MLDEYVNELGELLRPSWGSEQWILEGWNRISSEEKELIKNRMDELFKDGLPFELKHDKLFYIYTFSLLAQLEVLAIQVPLKFESKMSSPKDQKRMRIQLLDEIFHGMVFTKIVYLLCAPHALPPAYNENIEHLCNFIRNEDCPKIAVVLLNLIGEGWIEEIFKSLQRQGIAEKVFTTIIDDEHRHVCEADLYRDIGLPEHDLMRTKLEYLENQLLSNIFLQYKYVASVVALQGVDGAIEFLQELDKKHTEQIKKIGLEPSENWYFFMKVAHELFPRIQRYAALNHEIEMTPIRKVFMTQWDNPSDPTMVGEFNLNVSCIDFFNKKFPPETITTLMMHAISMGISENDSFRSFLSHQKMYQSKEAYVGLIVKLPECGDHIGTIVFENCHQTTVQELAVRVRNIVRVMVYCYKRREQLEQEYPHLKAIVNKGLYEFANDFYAYPMPGNSVVSLSNIGFCGYARTKSPLRSSEAMKITLLEVERKPVWNKATQEFEPQDILPVSISADHRIFDGNLPVPKLVTHYFNKAFEKMLANLSVPIKPINQHYDHQFVQVAERLLANNLEMGYKGLLVLQTYWLDFLAFEELFNHELAKEMAERLQEQNPDITFSNV